MGVSRRCLGNPGDAFLFLGRVEISLLRVLLELGGQGKAKELEGAPFGGVDTVEAPKFYRVPVARRGARPGRKAGRLDKG